MRALADGLRWAARTMEDPAYKGAVDLRAEHPREYANCVRATTALAALLVEEGARRPRVPATGYHLFRLIAGRGELSALAVCELFAAERLRLIKAGSEWLGKAVVRQYRQGRASGPPPVLRPLGTDSAPDARLVGPPLHVLPQVARRRQGRLRRLRRQFPAEHDGGRLPPSARRSYTRRWPSSQRPRSSAANAARRSTLPRTKGGSWPLSPPPPRYARDDDRFTAAAAEKAEKAKGKEGKAKAKDGVHHVPSRTIPLAKIATDPHNPNHMTARQMQALEKTVDRYGFAQEPWLRANADGTYTVIDGEHRVELLRRKKAKAARCRVFEGMEDADVRILRQVANKLHGAHDVQKDADEFRRIFEAGRLEDLSDVLARDTEQFEAVLEKRFDLRFERRPPPPPPSSSSAAHHFQKAGGR